MLRKDREITDKGKIVEIIKSCQVVNLAFNDTKSPYIVPMNFGYAEENGKIVLYFHCAKSGKKIELLASNSNVSFSMFTKTKLYVEDIPCKSTMKFESVCGRGNICIVDDSEKLVGLKYIMRQFSTINYEWTQDMARAVDILKLEVDEVTAKSNMQYENIEND